ncbi:MAG: hypothetical protein QXG39_09900 [Candidatus Aenigmatarchaeota archaeon]
MRVVFDSSAVIYIQDFRKFEEVLIPPSVVEEIKDKLSRMKLEAFEFKVVQPEKKFLEIVKKVAEKTGDLEKLSKADLEVLALAKQFSLKIVSDDYSIQNVAKMLGIDYITISTKGIKKVFIWKKFCVVCGRKFEKSLNVCPFCGGKLKRKPEFGCLKKRKDQQD